MNAEGEKTRITELDSLRGLAALSVLLFHLLLTRKEFGSFHILGFWGVALFFIISGFVIPMTIENKPSVRLFVINRFSRLYPAYWFSVIFVSTIVLVMSKGDLDWVRAIVNLTMFQKWFGIHDMDATYWTLRVELCFYFLTILLLVFSSPKKIVLCGAIAFIFLLLIYVLNRLTTITLLQDFDSLFPLVNNYGYFYSGVLFYSLSKRTTNPVLIILLLITCISFNLYSLRDFGNVNLEHIPFGVYAALVISCYVIFVLLIYHKLSFLKTGILKWFGEISYSLYITHFYFSYCFLIPILEARNVNWAISRFTALIFIILIAYFVKTKIEVPYMKKLREKLLVLFPGS